MKPLLTPSILAANFANLEADIKAAAGRNAMSIIQPIARYIAVDSAMKRPMKRLLKTIPATARPQMTPKSDQPHTPRRLTSMNGV